VREGAGWTRARGDRRLAPLGAAVEQRQQQSLCPERNRLADLMHPNVCLAVIVFQSRRE